MPKPPPSNERVFHTSAKLWASLGRFPLQGLKLGGLHLKVPTKPKGSKIPKKLPKISYAHSMVFLNVDGSRGNAMNITISQHIFSCFSKASTQIDSAFSTHFHFPPSFGMIIPKINIETTTYP